MNHKEETTLEVEGVVINPTVTQQMHRYNACQPEELNKVLTKINNINEKPFTRDESPY